MPRGLVLVRVSILRTGHDALASWQTKQNLRMRSAHVISLSLLDLLHTFEPALSEFSLQFYQLSRVSLGSKWLRHNQDCALPVQIATRQHIGCLDSGVIRRGFLMLPSLSYQPLQPDAYMSVAAVPAPTPTAFMNYEFALPTLKAIISTSDSIGLFRFAASNQISTVVR